MTDAITNPHHSEKLRILAADSTAMGTQLLVEALGKYPQFHVIEAPPIEEQILALAKSHQPEITLLSPPVHSNGQGAFGLIREIRSQRPETRVIVMLDRSEPALVVQAFRAGAHGIFCRTEPFRLLAKCIECVHAGQVWASSAELHFLLDALNDAGHGKFPHLANSPLSARESDVVKCVAEGLTNREIAQRLKLTEHTVKNYLFRIFDKLGVSSRVEVVLYALGTGEARTTSAPNGRKPQTGTAARKTGELAALAARRNGG
jgi:two-component system nitrate/nitrite response regulator NarL